MIESLFTITEVLYQGSSDVVRALRKSDGLACVVKSVRSGSSAAVSRAYAASAIWSEYEMLKSLTSIEGVVKVLEFISWPDGGAIVFRDTNGTSLTRSAHLISNQVMRGL
jgi:hypothetical protein